MRRMHTTILATGLAAAALPAVGAGAMAYVTAPRSITTPSQVMVANDNGTGARAIARGQSAAISPDGTKVAYQAVSSSSDTGWSGFVVEVATGARTALGSACVTTPVWSPDSQWLACQTQSANAKGFVTGNGLGLVSVPASLAGVATLPVADYVAAKGNAVDYGMAFSPDSTRIAFSFSSYPPPIDGGTLLVAPLSNSGAHTRVMTRASSPVWGDAGIAVARSRRVRVSLGGPPMRLIRTQVWTVQPDGTGARQVTRYSATGLTTGPYPVAWAPAGNLLLGAIGGEDQSDPITISVPGGGIRVLRRGAIDVPAAISADGRRVLYTAGMDGPPVNIRVIGTRGGTPRTLVRNASGPSVTAGWNG